MLAVCQNMNSVTWHAVLPRITSSHTGRDAVSPGNIEKESWIYWTSNEILSYLF